jgi:hypothetical protein
MVKMEKGGSDLPTFRFEAWLWCTIRVSIDKKTVSIPCQSTIIWWLTLLQSASVQLQERFRQIQHSGGNEGGVIV